MKRIYYFCECAAELQQRTPFYQVAFGGSRHDALCLQFVADYARANDCYFKMRNAESDEFICRVAESLFPGGDVSPLHSLNLLRIDCRGLVRLLRDGAARAGRADFDKPHAVFLAQLSLNFRVSRSIAKR